MPTWKEAYFCGHCDKGLSHCVVMYSHGVCPYCGHRGERAGTIVDHYVKSYRKERLVPWWQLWMWWKTRWLIIWQ